MKLLQVPIVQGRFHLWVSFTEKPNINFFFLSSQNVESIGSAAEAGVQVFTPLLPSPTLRKQTSTNRGGKPPGVALRGPLQVTSQPQ